MAWWVRSRYFVITWAPVPGRISKLIPASEKPACSDWAMSVNGVELITSRVTLIGVVMPASARICLAFSTS
ncbi:hypothetical protein D3C72_2436710 [compost metagenome]